MTIWDRDASSSGVIEAPGPGRHAFLHRPDGAIRPIAGFDGRDLNVPHLAAGDIPLVYEIRSR